MKVTAQQYILNEKGGDSYVSISRHISSKAERKVSKDGDVYGIIRISAQQNANIERISKFVWDSIVDGYLYSTANSTNESLKDAIAAGVKKVKDLITNNRELGESGVDIDFTVILIKEEGSYVGIFGKSEILAYKDGNLVDIAEILEKKKANTAGIALAEDDLLMVSTEKILSTKLMELSTLESKERILFKLNTLGKEISNTGAIMFFGSGVGKELKERRNILPSISKIKEETKKIVKPIARIEKIRRVEETKKEEGKLMKLFKEKYSKIIILITDKSRKVIEFLKPQISRIIGKLKTVSSNIQIQVSQNLGKRRWYKKVAARMSEIKIGGGRPSGVKGMKIDGYKSRDLRNKRLKILLLGVVVLGLLAFGINYTIQLRHAKEISRLANEGFSSVTALLDKVESNLVTDRSSAETYLFKAEKEFSDINKDLDEKDMEKYKDVKDRLLRIGDSLYKRVGVSEENGKLANFLDGRLSFGEGSDVVDISSYIDSSGNEYLVVADKGRKAIYRVSLYDKSVKAIPDNEGLVKSPEHVYVGTKGVYVFDSKGGILKASFDSDGWFSQFASLSGLGIENMKTTDVAELAIWTESDNVYLLSRDRKALLKSTPAYGDRYGLTYSYLTHDSMEKVTDMIADLSIYLIVPEDPHIVRFNYSYYESKYYEAPLGVLGFDGNYGKLTKAYTGDTLDSGLYVFDSDGRRFLKFEKPIESGNDARHPNQISLIAQYVYRGDGDQVLKNVRNFVVDAKEVNMYILDGSVIWKVGL